MLTYHHLKKLGRVLKRELWQRQRPAGLLSPLYFWPHKDARITLHRRFWWQQGQRWPRLVWLVMQIILWLRWQLIHSVPAYYRALKRYGPTIAGEEGISVRAQVRCLARLGLCWCIHPIDAYRFRLYRDPTRALAYVYAAETAAFHDWRSEARTRGSASKALLQDKTALAQLLSHHGIPVVTTLASLPHRHELRPLSDLMGDVQQVFCKMNSGHMGIGAFAAWRTATGLAGQRLTGEALADDAAVASAWQALCQLDQSLVQPLLQNHPALAALSYDGTVIRVRVATEWTHTYPSTDEALKTLCAFMVIPAGHFKNQSPLNIVSPIEVDTGQLGPPLHPIVMNETYRQAHTRINQLMRPGYCLPYWSQLVAHSQQSHRLIPDIQSIAWDWVLTPSGPILLEGNTAWGLTIPQQLTSGFLARHQSAPP